DYRYEGADLGILITRGRSMTEEFKLNPRAENWISGIQSFYKGRPLDTGIQEPAPSAGAFKIL
ncbi:MAG: biotin carboxylase, partial [Rhodobacteraceae bacterium]|nr:biotin carboxylase [Paracoccaceae bacterium]